jgi:signal transduction histidine kinase
MGAFYGKISPGGIKRLRVMSALFFFAFLIAAIFAFASYHYQKKALYYHADCKLDELACCAMEECKGQISPAKFSKMLSVKYKLRNLGQATITNGRLIHENGNFTFLQKKLNLNECQKACCNMESQFCTYSDSEGEWRVILIPALCNDKKKRIFAAAASLAPINGKLDDSIFSILSISALIFVLSIGFMHIAQKMHFRFAEETISNNPAPTEESIYNGAMFDAMESRISELEHERNHAQLEAKAKSAFLSNAAHELKTPLNPIIGFADMLIKENLGGVQLRMARQIHLNASKELELVEDILEYARLDTGRIKLELKDANIKNELETCVSIMKTLKKEASIRLTIDNNVGKFKVDPKRFRQIILKLLSNAVKFMPNECHINIHASIAQDSEKGEILRVSVRDYGIGIAESDFDKIFQPFGKLDTKETKSFEGIGLGLVTAKRLTELHGGSIELESKPGAGSRFTVNFPESRA